MFLSKRVTSIYNTYSQPTFNRCTKDIVFPVNNISFYTLHERKFKWMSLKYSFKEEIFTYFGLFYWNYLSNCIFHSKYEYFVNMF